jgi:tRNA threonylcarbamoyladenosine biosynthesis protein TsaE
MMLEKTYGLLEIPSLATEVLRELKNSPAIWLFSGEMGAGKTSLIKELGKQMGILQSVQSPTFSLINSYETVEGKPVYHFDLYRLKNTAEALEIGIEEYLDSGHLCLIEWPEQAEELWNIPHVRFQMQHVNENTRKLTCHWPS